MPLTIIEAIRRKFKMGMAASQGRFLSLTARKSNTEYEGQQVNQQRTALANQSAALNTQMLALSVPTPPDAEQYYNDQYVFEDGDKDFEIISGLGRESTIVRETVTKYKLYSQPTNLGNQVVLTMLENKLKINNNEMTMLSDTSSRAQIRNILDNGQSGDNPPFSCTGVVEGAGYSRINDNSTKMSDPAVQKYRNDYTEIEVPLTPNSAFKKNYDNGVPSYYVLTDSNGNKEYTLLTDANYDKLMEDAELNENAVIIQEKRDSLNHSIKVPVSQAEISKNKGLDFYVVDNAQKTWTKSDDTTTGQTYLTAVETTKELLTQDLSMAEKIANNQVVLFAKTTDENGVKYVRIETYEELVQLDDTKVYKVVDPNQSSGTVPTEGAIVDPANIIGIPVDKDDTTDYGNFEKYILTETVPTVTGGSFQLTQAMWDEAKKNGDTELMDYYIECLNFNNEDEASKNNYLYYYVNNNTVHYVQASYIPKSLLDGSVESEYAEIPQEFYEHAYDEYVDQTFTNCLWQKDNSSGRYVSMTGRNEDGVVKTYNLIYTRVKDDDAYDQAMMDYEYRKQQYEKAVSDINAETAIIQQQDKTLELRLRSLDTEQEALQQELDAVTKVINGNIEKTFNTFS